MRLDLGVSVKHKPKVTLNCRRDRVPLADDTVVCGGGFAPSGPVGGTPDVFIAGTIDVRTGTPS
jgi:hypothetical protein